MPTPSMRILKDIRVYSFYGYDEIKSLLLLKHKMVGSFVFRQLGSWAGRCLALNFKLEQKINLIPIDDRLKDGFSHSAAIARGLQSKNMLASYCCLHATSTHSYSGKDLEFRLNNPRNFKLLKRPKYPVILVDDIITTGSTMSEAARFLKDKGVQVLFGLSLADAAN